MTVDVLFFGILKDVFGSSSRQMELCAGANVEALIASLRSTLGDQGFPLHTVALAVNREYAGLKTVLTQGDEVALLPPVSGGRHAG